ncbi:hypothetical protein Cfor_05079 [Coptotermes formosanus]|uniref:G patch domain-containing protein 11 n=1 Tax=Coptotermes formosanus TaxID=36987 RepID=A0A6L2PTX3_COPFO|nr:hypothetical protein Cfor_05079 [Coptotermes formosanus]
MPSDDELDYMSDSFLAECVKDDIRPGLILSRTKQREHNIHKSKTVTDEKNKQQNRSHRFLEAERREEGLNEAIDDSNKGFALLQKMGYKPGMAIGKSGIGCVEPVPIALKSDRSGLGREAALKEIAAEKVAIMARQRARATNTQDYRARLTRKAVERTIEGDLRKSQRICEQLDTSKGFDEPAETWFWPPKNTQAADDTEDEPENQHTVYKDKDEDNDKNEGTISEEAEEIEFELPEKLEILTMYLRRTHLYCIWCGIQFDDDKDLQDACPGPSRDDH